MPYLLRVLVLVTFASCVAHAKSQELITNISVDMDRPLFEAVRQLAAQTKAFVTFEELLFEHRDDLVEAPPHQEGRVHFVPKYGKFDFDYAAATPVQDVLEAMLDRYHAEYPGNYKLLVGDEAFHIVPDSSKDLEGNFVPRTSLLESAVTLNLSNISAKDVVCEIARQVSVDNGVNLFCLTGFGSSPLEGKTFERYAAANANARDVLVDVLNEAGGNLSWVILRDINAKASSISFYRQPHS